MSADVSGLADDVAFVHGGRIIAQGAVADFVRDGHDLEHAFLDHVDRTDHERCSMNGHAIAALVRKDLHVMRRPLAAYVLAGLVSVALVIGGAHSVTARSLGLSLASTSSSACHST